MPHGSPSYEIKSAELKRLREEKGWSQRVLAAKCKQAGRPVDASRIARYEIGQSTPRPATLAVLVDVLGCKHDDLVVRAEVAA